MSGFSLRIGSVPKSDFQKALLFHRPAVFQFGKVLLKGPFVAVYFVTGTGILRNGLTSTCGILLSGVEASSK